MNDPTNLNEHYKLFFNASPDAALITRMSDGIVVELNEGFTRLTGFRREEIIGKSTLDINFWQNPLVRKEFVKELTKIGFVENYETVLVRKNGSLLFGIISAKIIELNSVLHIISITRDITEHKQIEMKLQISEAQKNAILNGISSNIAFIDKNLKIIWANNIAAESVHKTVEEMIGKTCHHIWADPSQPCENCPSIRAMKSLQPEHTIMTTPDGRIWDERGEPVFDVAGNLIGIVEVAIDITERKRSEQAIRDSEARFRSYFELPLIGIAITSPEMGWIEANNGIFNMLGYSMDELKTFSWDELTYPDDLEADVVQFNRVLAGEIDTYSLEKRFIKKNGEIIWVNLSVSCVRKPDRSVDYIVALLQDISDRKQAENNLKESEQRFREIMENVHLICVIIDSAGSVTFANNYFLNLTGWNNDEVLGQNWFERFIPPDTGVKQVLYGGFEEGSVPQYNQNEIITRTGERRLIDWSNTLLRDANGNSAGIAGIGIDITEQKRYGDALRKSEEKYRLIAENTSDVIWILNLSKQKFTFISPSVIFLRGYTVEEAMAQSMEESLTPESQKFVIENLNPIISKFLEDKNTYQTRQINLVQQPCKNGNIIWVEVATQLQFNTDGELEILGVSRNIEERKKMEDELRKSEVRHRELNATKDKFFSIIAHDLKSPFNSILGFSEMLKNEVRDLDIDSIAQYAGLIYTSANHTLELLDTLLEWASMQQGKIPFEPKTFLLNGLLQVESEMQKNTAFHKKVELINAISENIIIKADEKMIGAVIRNLISNAIKFTHRNGKVEISAFIKNGNVEILISDNGVGMKKETLEKLFKIETSFTTRGTNNEKGTGLGLLLCKEFIDKHGGKIWVESELGKGSTFGVSIPLLNK